MEFDPQKRGTATIRHILDRADRIVCGHHPELIRTEHGLTWTDVADGRGATLLRIKLHVAASL
ncbi:MAG: hypothetical protein AAFX39_06585, partial [Pseudomonadota bacterium]